MADSFGSYTYAFYMSGAVVIAGACIPFLLFFTRTKEPGAKTSDVLSESWELNDVIDGISITMNPDDKAEETGAETGSRDKTFVCLSSV